MARSYATVLTRVWSDDDWTSLDPTSQWAYIALLSQPNLNRAGVLPLTLTRWTRWAHGLTVADVEKLLQTLEDRRYVLVDRDTDEVLVRSFIRNDETWKQPKVWPGTVEDCRAVVSPRIRTALLAEVGRLSWDHVTDKSREIFDAANTRLAEGLRDVADNDPDTVWHTPSDTPSETVRDTQPDTPFDRVSRQPQQPSGNGIGSGIAYPPSRDARATPAPTPPPAPPPAGPVDLSTPETQRASAHARGSPDPWPDEPPF